MLATATWTRVQHRTTGKAASTAAGTVLPSCGTTFGAKLFALCSTDVRLTNYSSSCAAMPGMPTPNSTPISPAAAPRGAGLGSGLMQVLPAGHPQKQHWGSRQAHCAPAHRSHRRCQCECHPCTRRCWPPDAWPPAELAEGERPLSCSAPKVTGIDAALMALRHAVCPDPGHGPEPVPDPRQGPRPGPAPGARHGPRVQHTPGTQGRRGWGSRSGALLGRQATAARHVKQVST